MRLKHLVLPPSAGRYELLKPSRRTGADYFLDLLELYDGSNAEHVLDTMAESGFLHSAIPAPKNFILGVCSEEEIAEAKSALTPAAERILKAHLVDVFDDDVESPTLRMVLRSTDAANEGEEYSIPIPAGAFIVNATDHISTKTNHFAPILSGCATFWVTSVLANICRGVRSAGHGEVLRARCRSATDIMCPFSWPSRHAHSSCSFRFCLVSKLRNC